MFVTKILKFEQPSEKRVLLYQHLKKDNFGRIKLRWEQFGFLNNGFVSDLFCHVGNLSIDLNGISILGYDGLIWLLSIVASRNKYKMGGTYIYIPESHDFLDEIDEHMFVSHVENSGGYVPNKYAFSKFKPKKSYGKQNKIRFLQAINKGNLDKKIESVYYDFVDDLAEYLRRETQDEFIRETAWPFLQLLPELLTNITLHGGTPENSGSGFACIKKINPRYPKVRFVCSDLGSGFMTSFGKKKDENAFKSEGEAIKHGFLYRYFKQESGVLGLYSALNFIHLLYGKFYVRSKDSSFSINLENPETRASFQEGYENPSMSWLESISEIRNADFVNGVHIVIDLKIPELT